MENLQDNKYVVIIKDNIHGEATCLDSAEIAIAVGTSVHGQHKRPRVQEEVHGPSENKT